MPATSPSAGRSAGERFALLASTVVLLFAALVIWLALDQQQLIEHMEDLQTRTLPDSMEQQRLVRNLEVLRLTGEKLLYNPQAETRQQARYLMGMLTQHPGMREQGNTQDLILRVEQFVAQLPNQYPPAGPQARQWDALSRELMHLADTVSAQGVNLISDDMNGMEAVIGRSNHKLLVAILLALISMVGMMLLVSRVLIEPLKLIDRALSELRLSHHEVQLPRSNTTEIQNINQAIGLLSNTLQENDRIRAGLEVAAATDGLTGLINRRRFMEVAEGELARAQRYQRSISIGLADLDHFKEVNDQHGHQGGDTVLKAVAQFMQDTLRESDFVCRYGGEEFAFIFNEANLAEAHAVADRLCAKLHALPIELENGPPLHITLSMGLVEASQLSLDAALRQADLALYQAKNKGRNRVEVGPTGT